MPVGFFLLTLQGASELIKRIAFLTGKASNPLVIVKGPSAEEELAAEIKKHQVAPEVADIVHMNVGMVDGHEQQGERK